MQLRRHVASALAEAGDSRRSRRWKRLIAAAAAILPLSLLGGVAGIGTASASSGTVTYTATVDIPAPPASNFSGASAGGDGWAVEVTDNQLFNVFHHQSYLGVNCHNQSDASTCAGYPVTYNGYDTSGQPGMYAASNGNLYVYVTRTSDDTAGVACVTTSGPSFCGFTPLTGANESPTNPGWSLISDPQVVDGNFYAFDYAPGVPTGAEDQLMCFSLTTFSACANQPYSIFSGLSSVTNYAPSPSILNLAGQIVIPIADGGGAIFGCYDPSAGGSCPGSWPITTSDSYLGNNGSLFQLLDASGNLLGFCEPTGASPDPCYTLQGAPATGVPSNLGSVITGTDSWNGPALVVGARVYVPNGNASSSGEVQCYDYSTGGACANFPKSFSNMGYLYTVNHDPQRPTCLWVNSDNGTTQIQNFDAYSGQACGVGPIRLLASSFVAPSSTCFPASWTSLQITNPYPPSNYGGGSVAFENSDGANLNTSPQANPAPLDSTASVNLTPYNFGATLPQFLMTLNSPPVGLSSLTVDVSWQGTQSSSCTMPGTGISGEVTLTGPAGSSTIGQSQTLSAVVDANDSPLADGTVTFTCVSGPNCTATPSGTGITDSTGTATFTYSGSSPGTDTWQASYTPSSGSTETSSEVSVVWTKIATTEGAVVALTGGCSTSWGSSQPLGSSACASATFPQAPAGGPALTGTVTYDFFGNQFCASDPSASDPVTIAGGTVPDSTTGNSAFGPLTPGAYSVQAVYSGDGNYTGATSPCATFTVSKASPSVGTTVDDAATEKQWSSDVTGASAYDTSSVTGVSGYTPTGLVLYDLYRVPPGSESGCSSTPLSTNAVTLSQGVVPDSPTTAPLAAGTYAFRATYEGDPDYNASNGPCETFVVGEAGTTTAGAVYDELTNGPWLGTEVTNSEAYGTAAVAGSPGVEPGGALDYYFYSDASCSVELSDTQVTLSQGSVPTSATVVGGVTPPLPAGTHSLEAVYDGDANYVGSNSGCLPFSVGIAPQTISSVVWDYTGDGPWGSHPATEVTGATAFDTSSVPAQTELTLKPHAISVTGGGYVVPTGTVTYSFFDNGTCSGDPATSPEAVGIEYGGGVPDSSVTSPLPAGGYSYQASYGGDSNYQGVTGACEPFTVQKAAPEVRAGVDDSSTGSPWSGTEVTGASAFATSTVAGVEGFTPTGTVTYDLYNGSGEQACAGEPLFTDTETLSGGLVPDSVDTGGLAAGRYYFEATYSGDSNYLSGSETCVPFLVDKAPVPVSNQVFDVPPGGLEQTGSQAYDTATLTTVKGFVPTGTVTYALYGGASCEGDPMIDPQTVNLDDYGNVPASADSPALGAGTYSYLASYSGDDNYVPSYLPAAGVCQSFSVGQATPVITVAAQDASTEAPWLGTEVTGASAFATAVVTGVEPFTPTGPLSFALFDNGTCSGDPVQTWPPPETDGALGGSSGPSGPLAGGTYGFVAAYGGDGNYLPATSNCAPFTVLPAASLTSGVVHDSATHGLWTGNEHQGAAAYDVAAVGGGLATFPQTGSVTYTFYRNAGCLGSPATTQTVPVSAGAVPASASTGELPPGGLSFLATYSGDSNYAGSASGCQSFKAQVTGYRLQGGDGGLFAFHDSYRGSVGFPSPPGLGLKIYDFVGMAPAANGYWMVRSNGGLFRFGTAAFHGSLPSIHVTVSNVVGIAATPDFGGYWIVTRTGHVYGFGDAHYHGGANATDIVAIVSPDAGGYWLLGSNGAVYPFGDARHLGDCTKSGSGCRGATNIVGFASPDAGGYWLVSKTGAVYGFGDAHFRGSCWTGGSGCFGTTDVVGIAGPDENGYWLAGAKGEVHAFGDAQALGNEVGAPLVRPMIAISR